MKSVIWKKYGAPDVLKFGEATKPRPKPDEILIKVMATTVTLGDCEIRGMSLPLAFRLPIMLYLGFPNPRKGITLGQEFSGVVAQTGANISRFSEGDEVLGQTNIAMGAYAQYLVQKENGMIASKPSNVSFEQAACLPLGGLESYYFIKNSGLRRGSRVLVIGAGGSIGTMGIQLLKRLGATVVGVDTGEKFDVMKQTGADSVIDYTKQVYFDGVPAYDGIFDVVGKTPLKQGLALLAENGVYMHANPKISQMIFSKRLGGKGKRVLVKTGDQSHADLEYLSTLMAKGEITPIIDKTLPLENIVEAHEYVEANKKKGNLVITIGQD